MSKMCMCICMSEHECMRSACAGSHVCMRASMWPSVPTWNRQASGHQPYLLPPSPPEVVPRLGPPYFSGRHKAMLQHQHL